MAGVSEMDAGSARPVLVVGASGKTGRAVAGALVARGIPVRAAVRVGREAAAPPGTTAVAVDLESGHGLGAALDGVGAAYHLAPNVHPDEVGMAARMADAVTAAGVSRLVFHSVLHPGDTRMPHHLRKAEAEGLLRDIVGERLTVLRPAAYHQNLVGAALGGTLRVPYDLDAPFTNVELADVAQVAADALAGRHAGATLDLAGPEVLTVRDMAEQAGAVLGREVRPVHQSRSEWLFGPGATLTAQARHDLAAMFAAYDDGGLVGDTTSLAALLGRRPTTWAQAVSRST
jgi:NAD(P)H dehydrogenase (quinone)